jgi:hypothetical protein
MTTLKLFTRALWIVLTLTASAWAAEPSRPANLLVPALPKPNSGPVATEVVVRVVAHGAMVLGSEVGGAKVTITDPATGTVLASGLQTGEAGDQNQIMHTPRLLEEPRYSGKPAASFRTTLHLDRPTLVDITAEGPLGFPSAIQRTSKTVLLVPGMDVSQDGIVLDLNGYIIQIENPSPSTPLIAKDDVKLQASVRMLSGALVRPHGDWDSRKVVIYGEVLIGDRIVERLQMFYSGSKSTFEAQFFVPTPAEAPDGITLRVVAADGAGGNFGVGQAIYPVLTERLKPARKP